MRILLALGLLAGLSLASHAQQRLVSYNDYDLWGNLLKATDANGQVIRYYYGSDTQPLSQTGLFGVNGVYLTGVRREGSPNLDQIATYNERGQLASLTDASGVATRYYYDAMGRLEQVANDAGQPVSAYQYAYSAVNNGGSFSSSDPNLIRTLAFKDGAVSSDFSTAAGWTVGSGASPDVTFGVAKAGQTTVRMGTDGNFDSIKRPAGPAPVTAKVDFYPDGSTGGTPHVLFFEGQGFRFAVHYQYTSDRFRVQYQKNGGSYSYSPSLSLAAPPDQWYTIEIEKNADGVCRAFIYPKGGFRSAANSYSLGGYPSQWDADVQSSGSDDYFYLANFYAGSYRQSVTYLDGLGRPIQSQQREGTDDIVVANTYDGQGLEQKAYKPYRQSNALHVFRPNFDGEAKVYYDGSPGADAQSRPFAETKYEESPLERQLAVLPPGTGSESTALRFSYSVKAWMGSNYQVTTTTDEDERVTQTWTDGWGRTVRTVAAPGTPEEVETVFTYDLQNRMKTVTAPNGLTTRYRYNARGELIAKTTPDADGDGNGNPADETGTGTSVDFAYTYDGAGNLRFTQDPNRAAAGQVAFTSYDDLDRPVAEGVASAGYAGLDGASSYGFESDTSALHGRWAYDSKPNSGDYPWNQFSTLIDDAFIANSQGQLTAQAWRFNRESAEAVINESDLTLNPGQSKYLVASQQITIDGGTVDSGESLTLESGGKITIQPPFTAYSGSSVSARIVATPGGGSTIAGANPWQLTLFSYDNEGRVADKWIWTGDRRDWDTHLSYRYNRQGEITRRKIKVGPDSLYQHYSYNQRGLLAAAYISTDGVQPAAPEVSYTYTATGAIDQIDYKGSNDVDYAYTIRDWVERINNVGSIAGNFAAEYKYYDNGNVKIAEFHNPQVQSGGGTNTFNWKLTYDNLNRLSNANYDSTSSSTSMFDVTGLAYDDAGNITYLKRRDETGSLIDDLDYLYGAGTNRLQEIQDAAGQQTGWDAFDSTFGYDENGNMTSQSGKLIGISYDHRNLPVQFALEGGGQVLAGYNAEGQRILKELKDEAWQFYVTDGSQTVAVIDTAGLSHINLIGKGTFGRWEPGGTRRYYLTDHLGSTRAVVDDQGNVLETFDYYPFGLLMPKRSSTTGNTIEKFTGKELDEATNHYYFSARYYDPALGRFLKIDRYADKYPEWSPYNYTLNNPIGFTDTTGDTVEVAYVNVGSNSSGSGVGVGNHTLIIHTNNKTGKKTNIVEGFPENRIDQNTAKTLDEGFGKLTKLRDTDPNSDDINGTDIVSIPEGMTEEEFVGKLTGSFDSYDNAVDYGLVPSSLMGTGNSNSLVGSVLRKSGSNFKPSKSAPGFGVDVLPGQNRSSLTEKAKSKINSILQQIEDAIVNSTGGF